MFDDRFHEFSFLSVDYWPTVTVQRRPSKFFDRSERNGSVARATGQTKFRRLRCCGDAAAIPMVEEIARVKGRPRLGDSIAERRCARARVRACVCAPTRAAGCMPAGVIDIGKYAMADRSQRAGTNDCSAAHTAALRIHSRASSSAIRL